MRKLVAIEGGWGSGKTTLLNSVENFSVLPSVVPKIFDIIGRTTKAGPESDPEMFSSLFFALRSSQLEKFAMEDGGPILCDRTLFAPIALRRFHNLPVPASFFTAIEFLRDSGLLHNTVFFAEQIPMKNLEKGWPKRRFNFGQAERYSKITERGIHL